MERNTSMLGKLPALKAKRTELHKLPDVKTSHDKAVRQHHAKIKTLKDRKDLMALYDDITTTRSKVISRFLNIIEPGDFNHGAGAVSPDLVKFLESVPMLD